MSFDSMGLAQPLLRAIETLGFTEPTPVQVQAIPAGLLGGDWMVSSQTGSGKTAAYLLPLLHHLIVENDAAAAKAAGAPGADGAVVEGAKTEFQAPQPRYAGKGGGKNAGFRRAPAEPRLLVLCPTRELAEQVCRDAIELLKQTRGIRVAMVIGGMPFPQQIAALQGAHLVVATPGRLLDLENKRSIRLDSVKSLVVDEADRMLDLGFAEDLEAIQDLTSARDQTLMFSATFAPRIMALAETMMTEPGRIEVGSAQEKHQDITQSLHWADNYDHKRKLLEHLIRDEAVEQAVIFVSTQVDSETLAEELEAQGYSVAAMHGAMPQFLRQRRLRGLREGKVRLLVATDVAARGLDVPSITHVINFGLPMKAEDYVHRIGRTGRAGRSGVAVTLADHRDRFKIRDIERYTQQPIPAVEIAGLEPRAQPKRSSGGPREGAGRSGGGRDFGNRDFGNRSGGGGRDFGGRGRDGGNRSESGFARSAPSSSGPTSSFNQQQGEQRRGGFKPEGGFRSEGGFRPEGGFKPEGGFRTESKFKPEGGFRSERAPRPTGPTGFAPKPWADRSSGEKSFGDKRGGEKFGERRPTESRFAEPRLGESKFGDSRGADQRGASESRFGRKPFGEQQRAPESRFAAARPAESGFARRRSEEPRTTESRFERKPAGGAARPAQPARAGQRFATPRGVR